MFNYHSASFDVTLHELQKTTRNQVNRGDVLQVSQPEKSLRTHTRVSLFLTKLVAQISKHSQAQPSQKSALMMHGDKL